MNSKSQSRRFKIDHLFRVHLFSVPKNHQQSSLKMQIPEYPNILTCFEKHPLCCIIGSHPFLSFFLLLSGGPYFETWTSFFILYYYDDDIIIIIKFPIYIFTMSFQRNCNKTTYCPSCLLGLEWGRHLWVVGGVWPQRVAEAPSSTGSAGASA